MPRLRTRITTDDVLKVPVQSLYRRGKLKAGQFSEGPLLDRTSPRFTALLGYDGVGWIEVGSRRWTIEKRSLRQGGFRLSCRGSNGRRHLNLFITQDGSVGTASQLGLIWTTKRLTKSNRALCRRRKLLRRLEGKPYSWEWIKTHPDYTPKRPHGMSKKRFRRLVNDGVYYRRKRIPKTLSRARSGRDDIQAINRIFGKVSTAEGHDVCDR